MNNNPLEIRNQNIAIRLAGDNRAADVLHLNLAGFAEEAPAFTLFKVAISNGMAPEQDVSTKAYMGVQNEMVLRRFTEDDAGAELEYYHEEYRFSALVRLRKIPGAELFEQTVSVTNEGPELLTLTHVSSAFIGGVALDGKGRLSDYRNVRLHYCIQAWEGEGQWRSVGLEEAGIYNTCLHACKTSFEMSSNGSYSTARRLPLLLVEDPDAEKIWYLQLNASSCWQISAGYMTKPGTRRGSLFMQAGFADSRSSGFECRLQPGESFTAAPAAFGCCRGSLDEAAANLTVYRRLLAAPPAWQGEMPVFFNDYMNCLWADPTEENSRPLIDRAKEAGFEGYCIDAGWFADRGISWGALLGDWSMESNRFGPNGLKGLIAAIRAKGLIPGVWMEMEVCSPGSQLGKRPDDWFLCRDGCRCYSGGRWFLDYRNEQVRAYMMERIDRLIETGVGFIKNDYNACVGIGTESERGSYSMGLIENGRAFRSFVDQVRAKYPTLILEACASGAMREDYDTIPHFHIQSVSDQEDYLKMPSILIGSAMNLLPEQMGIWAFPIPRLFGRSEEDFRQDCLTRWKDGEETVFNMASGMMGCLYVSGRLDRADDRNFALIQEGVALYKEWRPFIRRASPIFPAGMLRFCTGDVWTALGLYNREEGKILLTVWRLDCSRDEFRLHMPRYLSKGSVIRQLYPAEGFRVQADVDREKGDIVFRYPSRNTARVFELTV